MKLILATLLAGYAAAFAPSTPTRAGVSLNAAIDDLKVLAKEANPVVNFYDPLDLAGQVFWEEDNDATIAWIRHAEIKHGRVAMAAFVGYIAQSNGFTFPWPMDFAGNPFPADAGSPPEQWDAMSDSAKYQIILFIGFLEWFSEATGTHYMRGGVPGKFPDFNDPDSKIPHPVPFNLYDPFKTSKNRSPEKKADGLVKEINNGRLAMIGIMGFLAEQSLEGSVPLLTGLVPHYDGEVMNPFP